LGVIVNLEQLGLFGVFLAGAIPWFEAIGVVPAGIFFGLDPVLVVASAVFGNVITIFVFAFGGSKIRDWFISRAEKKNQNKPSKWEKAQKSFDKYGIYGMALLGPILIGTQFAAAVAVAAGVRPLKTSVIISIATALWAILIAVLSILGGLDTLLERQLEL
jgi:membrane protein DedA with SNARE-associated domain